MRRVNERANGRFTLGVSVGTGVGRAVVATALTLALAAVSAGAPVTASEASRLTELAAGPHLSIAADDGPIDPDNPLGEERAEVPEDADFRDIVYVEPSVGSDGSPSSDSGGRLYALGSTKGFCERECAVLFESTDAGATWQKLDAAGLDGSAGLDAKTLLVPPGYPTADRRMFAMGVAGLQVSTDGGETFRRVETEPFGGSAAISPAFADGDERILIGATPNLVYDAERDVTRPFGTAFTRDMDFSFAPGDGRTVFAATALVPPDERQALVFRCDDEQCGTRYELEGARFRPGGVLVTSSFADGGTVLAWAGNLLYALADDRSAFRRVTTLPLTVGIDDVAEAPDGALYLAATNAFDAGRVGGVLRSRDGGSHWKLLTDDPRLRQGVARLVALPNRRLIATPTVGAGGGVLCSSDGGKTWAPRCSA